MALDEAVGPNDIVEFETEDGSNVSDVPEDELKALLLSMELGMGKDSVPEFTVPPDGAVGLGSAVIFVKGKGGMDGDTSDVSVGTPVPEAEP